MSKENKDFFAKLIKSLSAIESNEIKATFLSFTFVFILMAAYYLLRPVRDAMASDWTDTELSMLWTLNFFISTAIVAVWGFVIARIPFNKLVPGIYTFFATSFVFFFFATQSLEDRVLVDKSFYIWVSVFALFHVSVFWSYMADIFNKEQAKRLFAVIAAGASLGAIFGPLLSGFMANAIGIYAMMLIAAVMLMIPVPIILYLARLKQTELGNAEVAIDIEKAKIGGYPLRGFHDFFTNPYLLGIGIFIILYTGIGSFVYFEQKNLLAEFTLEERTSIYGYRDAVVNTLTYLLAFFLTGRLVTKLGMPVTLAVVPVVLIFGMLILSFSPVLMVAVTMHVVLRAGNYGLTRPAREMLFTLASREDRFKTKPVIDIVAYRGGDVIMGWFFTGLSTGLGLGLAAIAAVGAGIAAVWAFVGYRLGRRFDRQEAEHLDEVETIAAKTSK
ncbi:MAG: MFS transporter [Pseudomonadales bacterium]|nr:MFS transporter [Pseudomonadales bacterium]MCP5213393.1 MFS transporter [Pseudomonadales bacterium]